MTTLQKAFKASEFKNPKVANAVKALADLQKEFEQKNRGNDLGGHLISLANNFREDRLAILNMLEGNRLAIKRGKASNGVIVRPQKVVRSNKRKAGQEDPDDCPGCDKPKVKGGAMQEVSKEEIKKMNTKDSPFAPASDQDKTGGPTSLEDLANVKSWREIMNAFIGLKDPMLEFMKLSGIPKPKAQNTKPETLAKKIFTHLKNEGILNGK